MTLPYLDMVVKETLRKYPPLPFLDRVAMHDYGLPGTELVIEKGTPVYIPMLGLHYDPEYFPNPEKYDPERFTEENKHKRPAYVYMPFGEGQHNCIGKVAAFRFFLFSIIPRLINRSNFFFFFVF